MLFKMTVSRKIGRCKRETLSQCSVQAEDTAQESVYEPVHEPQLKYLWNDTLIMRKEHVNLWCNDFFILF